MPANAHFIQAIKLLTPGASYHADLVLPHVHDLAGICQRVTINSLGDAFVSCEGEDARGDTLKFLALAHVPAPSSPERERPSPPSVIDSAVIVALLLDEVVAEFGLERTVAAAWAYKERVGLPASVGSILADILSEVRDVKITLSTPGARLRLQADGSMTIGLQISR